MKKATILFIDFLFIADFFILTLFFKPVRFEKLLIFCVHQLPITYFFKLRVKCSKRSQKISNTALLIFLKTYKSWNVEDTTSFNFILLHAQDWKKRWLRFCSIPCSICYGMTAVLMWKSLRTHTWHKGNFTMNGY